MKLKNKPLLFIPLNTSSQTLQELYKTMLFWILIFALQYMFLDFPNLWQEARIFFSFFFLFYVGNIPCGTFLLISTDMVMLVSFMVG